MRDHALIIAFDRVVLAKVRFIAAPVGAGQVARLLRADGVTCHAFDVRNAIARLANNGFISVHKEWGDLVPRVTAREPFSN